MEVYKRERLCKLGHMRTKKDTVGLSAMPVFLSPLGQRRQALIFHELHARHRKKEQPVAGNGQTKGAFASSEQRMTYRLILSRV